LPAPNSNTPSPVLVGTSASVFSMPYKPLDAAPPAIPVGIPSQLLERRPDIAASERNMAAANAQIGIATAASIPISLSAPKVDFESSALQSLMTWPSRFWSVGPSISENNFRCGLRRATVNQFVAVYNADVAAYRQTVLIAFNRWRTTWPRFAFSPNRFSSRNKPCSQPAISRPLPSSL